MNWIAGLYIASMIYCIIKLQKRYQNLDLGGGIGMSPGLDIIMVVLLAPFLTIVDVSLTWIRLYKEAEQARRNKTKIL